MQKTITPTVQEYLEALPADRRAVVSAVREIVLQNLPDGYQESIGAGMLAYSIPLERFPNTYNKQPLMYVALAAQKNYYSLHLLGVYMQPEREQWLRDAFARAGKKMDMGKACLRFKKLEDLPLDVIAQFVASIPPESYLSYYEQVRKK
jgi:hypothetical protein